MHKKSPVYVDPSGEQYFGYDEGAYYRMIEAMAAQIMGVRWVKVKIDQTRNINYYNWRNYFKY